MRLVVLALVTVPALAAAQPGPDDPSPPGLTPPIVAPAPPPLSPIDQADRDDAAADRAFGTSSALVVPRGRVDLSLRGAQGGGVFSAAIGLGHGIEISGDLGGSSLAALVGGDIKIELARTRTWAVALDGGYHFVGIEDSEGGGFNLGGVMTYAADSAVLSLGGGVLGGSGGGAVGYYANASLVIGRGAFRPIVEGATLDGPLWWFGGARLGNGHACLDIGFGGGGAADGTDGVGPVPLVGLTLRP